MAADGNAPALRIVEAQEQPGHRRLARAARSDDPDPLTGLHVEGQAVVRRATATRIGERHGLEAHGGRERARVRQRRLGVPDQGLGLEDLDDAARGGDAEHPLMQDDPQLAQRPEHLDAQHEDDQERAQLHLSGPHPEGAPAERQRCAHGHAGVGDAPGERVRPEDAHGAVEKAAPFVLQQQHPRAALAEGLQRRQALDRVEELRAEGGVGLLAGEARPAVLPVPEGRRDQRHEGGGEQHQRDREIHEGDKGEDENRGEGGDDELGKVLAEVDLELLDALDHREDDVPGASPGEVRGAQRGDALVDGLAQGALHARRRAVRRHRAPVVERAAKDDRGGREGDERQQRAERPAGDHVGEEPAEEGQTRDAGADGDEAE